MLQIHDTSDTVRTLMDPSTGELEEPVVDLTADSDGDGEDDDDVIITRVECAANRDVRTLAPGEVAASPGSNRYQTHNRSTLSSLRPGDLVEFHRGLYTHWGVSIGEGQIIHLSGEDGDGLSAHAGGKLGSVSGTAFTISGVQFEKARVKCEGFWEIARDSKADKNNSKDEFIRPDAEHVIVNRALSKMGIVGYNMLWSNCEHFSSWCRYGMAWSEQVDKFVRVFDRGKKMLTSALMLFGVDPPRLWPYARRRSFDENRNDDEESKGSDEDGHQTVPKSQKRFPELEYFNG